MAQDDGAIVERVLAGDREAFGLLIDRHRIGATRLANRILRGRADADDVAQEALLHAFLELDRLRARERFGPWLLGIVVNLAKTRLRSGRETPVGDWAGGRAVRGFIWMDDEPTPDARYEARALHDLVWRALGELPAEQQEAVQLRYVDELRVWEIAALVGAPAGTVKARLHRARGRLRLRLVAELGVPFDGDVVGRAADRDEPREETAMIEVTVEDVVIRVPREGEVRYLRLDGTSNCGPLRVIVLKERDGRRVLPIWVGAPEGDAIALALAGIDTPRPLSLALMHRVLGIADIAVERVTVNALRDNVFHAVLALRIQGVVREVDARPSDAITLALYAGAPVSVAPGIFDMAFVVDAAEVMPALEARHERGRVEKSLPPEDPPMQWRSFRTLSAPGAAGR